MSRPSWEKPRVWTSIGDKRQCCPTDKNAPHAESCTKPATTWGNKAAEESKAVVNQSQSSTAQSPIQWYDLQVNDPAVNVGRKKCAICDHDPDVSVICRYNCGQYICTRPPNHEGPHHSHYDLGTKAGCNLVWRTPGLLCNELHTSGRKCERYDNHADQHYFTLPTGAALIW